MTDKPKIEVGQRWVTGNNLVARIVATDCGSEFPVLVLLETTREALFYDTDGSSEDADGEYFTHLNLKRLAPVTVKREVALYRYEAVDGVVALETAEAGEACRISEPLTIEFTLRPGESGE